MRHKKPFVNTIDSENFIRCFAKELEEKVKEAQKIYVSKENVLHFNHGISWQSHNSNNPEEISTMQRIQNNIMVEQSAFTEYRVDILQSTLQDMANSIMRDFTIGMFSALSEACDANGQIVDGSEMSPVDSFLEMLERIEFGVDRAGKPVMPTVHVGPGGYDVFKNDPKFMDPETQIKIEKITERKQCEAMEKERARLAKYKGNHD